ncbi:flippase [Candidatus Berkelbacteria bacterium]|nr:flippase [Candidatus Berkelbacteria bacterium]
MDERPKTATQLVATNTAVQFVGKLVVMFLGLGTIALVTRYLGVGGFGQFTTIFAYVSFLSVFADFGFFAVLVTQLAKGKGEPRKIASNIMTLRALLGIAIYLVGFAVAFLLPYEDAVKLGIGIIAGAWFGQSVNQTLVGVFQVNQAMAKPVVADILGKLAVLSLVWFSIMLGLPLHMVLVSYLIGAFITLILNLYLVRAYVAVSLAYDARYWREVITLAAPMAAVLIFGFIYFKADTVILSLMKGPVDVGIYGVPYKLIEVLLVFPSIFMGTVLPFITRYLASSDARMAGAFAKASHFLILIGLPVLLVGMVLAKPLVAVLGGADFTVAATVLVGSHAIAAPIILQILLVAVFLSYLSHLTTYVVVAAGRQSSLVIPNILFAVCNIGLNILAIPHYSYLAAAAITVVTELAVLAVSFGIIWFKIGRFFPDVRYIARALVANAILVAAIYPLRLMSLPALLVIAVVVYGLLSLGFKLITREELLEVLQSRKGAHATT